MGQIACHLIVFLSGFCGLFNIRTAFITLKYGTLIERLTDENKQLKAQLKKYERLTGRKRDTRSTP
jgi:hypothetical protein